MENVFHKLLLGIFSYITMAVFKCVDKNCYSSVESTSVSKGHALVAVLLI